jgi:hypothetical protein
MDLQLDLYRRVRISLRVYVRSRAYLSVRTMNLPSLLRAGPYMPIVLRPDLFRVTWSAGGYSAGRPASYNYVMLFIQHTPAVGRAIRLSILLGCS